MRRELFPILSSRDLAARTAWYVDVLGAVEAYRFPAEGAAVYLTVEVGGSTLGLADGTGPTAYGADPLPASGHPVDLCVYVDDLDATLDRAGDAVAVPADDMPWGERVAWVRDPEGIMLLVIQGEPEADQPAG